MKMGAKEHERTDRNLFSLSLRILFARQSFRRSSSISSALLQKILPKSSKTMG
jgi:hypothetical protein